MGGILRPPISCRVQNLAKNRLYPLRAKGFKGVKKCQQNANKMPTKCENDGFFIL